MIQPSFFPHSERFLVRFCALLGDPNTPFLQRGARMGRARCDPAWVSVFSPPGC